MAFKKGMSVPLAEHHIFLEGVLTSVLFVVFILITLAVLNGWREGRLNSAKLNLRVFRALLLIVLTGIFVGVWR